MVVITKWSPEVGRPWRAFSGRVEKAGTQATRNPTGANEIATTKKARFAHAHLVASGTYVVVQFSLIWGSIYIASRVHKR